MTICPSAGVPLVEHEILESTNSFLIEGLFRSSQNDILYANAAFVRMFGYNDLNELLTVPENSLYASEECRKYLTVLIDSNEVIVNEKVLYRRKDGRTFWGLLSSRKLVIGRQVCYDARVLDLSSQVETELMLEAQTSQLEKLSMELDRFIYSASHDMRAPISTLMGIINLMKLELHDEQIVKYVNMMELTMARLDKFVQSLIAYAKNVKTPVRDTTIHLPEMFSDLMAEFRHEHPAWPKVQMSVDIDTEFAFYSDPERLRLVLYNVIKNALDFCDERKSTRILSVQGKVYPEKLDLEIFDNGIGIASAHINNVFEMFYRGTSVSKGSGIGLYSVRETVRKLGGVVSLDSKFGIGTSVKIQLPNSKKGRLINKKSLMKLSCMQ